MAAYAHFPVCSRIIVSESSHAFVRDWHNATHIHPLGLAALAVCGVTLLVVRRQHATWPILFVVCFVPSAQRINIAGADFDLLRILLIFGTVRVLVRGELHSIRWNQLDTAVVVWALASAIIPVLREGPSLLVNRLGHLYDIFGMYFLSRLFIRDWQDLTSLARGVMYISIPVATAFAFEWITARNVFSIFGGVPEVTAIRDGRLRCQGAFSHPILAGVFWAAALPLIVSQWWWGSKFLTCVSSGAALFIVVTCASATPVVGVLAAGIAAAMFWLRNHLRAIRWGVAGMLVILHLVMNAPVWHLIARTSSLGGSSWHRYLLVDGAIRHVDEWWVVGSSVGTAHWGAFTFDVANVYVQQAVMGGALVLLLFILIQAAAYRQLGRILSKCSTAHITTVWAIGTMLFVHSASLFGVSYFGQIWWSWYVVLGLAGSLPTVLKKDELSATEVRRGAEGIVWVHL